MKNTKKVMCYGLAFFDKTDMKRLHNYALKGWIFKELTSLFYILYKEEPQDLIFDYDIATIAKDDFDDYNQIFINAGWTPLNLNKQKEKIHFFSAKTGTVTLHSDKQMFEDKYKSVAISYFIIFIICLIALIVGLSLKILIIVALSAGIMAASAMVVIASYYRSNGKHF